MSFTVWTIGHSTRSLEDFLSTLHAHQIELIADVRRFPGSRRLPQYSAPQFESGLAAHGIAYQWLPALGGRRTLASASESPEQKPVSAWRHRAFRAYAEHVHSEEFASGLFELFVLAQGMRTAVMCAEILWWRCHRRLIADVLTSLDVRVEHIRNEGEGELHRLTPPARLHQGQLTYATDVVQVTR